MCVGGSMSVSAGMCGSQRQQILLEFELQAVVCVAHQMGVGTNLVPWQE